ncbi:MAG: ATPase, partial [bacterium]|nr:ATPase [bacterium]
MTRASYVINSRGEKEPFSFGKVYGSARKVGASKKLAREIAEIIGREAYPGIKTFEIFRKVRKLLNREIPKAALRFNLKKAMQALGPTVFPFEKYIGDVFSRQGFKVKLNQIVPG